MSTPQYLFFDLDGTLVDSREGIIKCIRHSLEILGVGVPARGDAGLVNSKPTFAWTGSSVLAQALYHLRHLQHHMAELNSELIRRGLPQGEWK